MGKPIFKQVESYYEKILRQQDKETQDCVLGKNILSKSDYAKLKNIQIGNFNSWTGRSY